MPNYEYECQSCGYSFEKFQYMSEEPLKKCPKCKKNRLKRLISAGAGIIFKGSGFYATDYRKDKNKTEQNKQGTTANTCPKNNHGQPDCSSCQVKQ